MNLDDVYTILVATNEQPNGSLKITNLKLELEVREMEEAGLITATLDDGKEGSFTAVTSVTHAGRQFLRAFRRHDFSQPARIVVPFEGQRSASR